MSFKHGALCAAFVFSLGALDVRAAVITNAGSGSTSNKCTTTTSGQRSILMNVDPFSVASFQLDVSFEADKAQFVSIQGLNGYIVDDFQVITDGSFGRVLDIHGYFPGFQDRFFDTGGDIENGVPVTPPPAGENDIFQLVFLDLRPDLDKHFGVFAGGPDDYLRGFDPQTGGFTLASGPANPQTGLGVQPAFAVVPGIPGPGGGPNDVPLPGALLMGLATGTGVLTNRLRRRNRAA
jgi:hypothetical protein